MMLINMPNLGTILQPGGLIAWLIVGLVAGFLANVFIRGRSSGCIGNIIVGLVGSVIGGLLASVLGFGGQYYLVGTIVISFIGACILLAVLQFVTGGRR